MTKLFSFLIVLISAYSVIANGVVEKDATAIVPEKNILLNSENQQDIMRELEKAKLGAKEVQATFACNFEDTAVGNKVRLCKLVVIRSKLQ